MAQNPTAAAGASRGKAVDRAFERIECIGFVVDRDLKTFVVGISALVATFHNAADLHETCHRIDCPKRDG